MLLSNLFRVSYESYDTNSAIIKANSGSMNKVDVAFLVNKVLLNLSDMISIDTHLNSASPRELKTVINIFEGGFRFVEIWRGIYLFQNASQNNKKILFQQIILHLINIPRLVFNALQASNVNVNPALAPAFLVAETGFRLYSLISRLSSTQLDMIGRVIGSALSVTANFFLSLVLSVCIDISYGIEIGRIHGNHVSLDKKNIGILLALPLMTCCYAKLIDHTLDELLKQLGTQLSPNKDVAKQCISIIIATFFTISTAVGSGLIQSSLMDTIRKTLLISLAILLFSTVAITAFVGSHKVFKNLNLNNDLSQMLSMVLATLSFAASSCVFDSFGLAARGDGATFFYRSGLIVSSLSLWRGINKIGDLILDGPMSWNTLKYDFV